MSQLLQIAIDENNNVVSIFQVATGKKCNCRCPECGEILEAKNKGKSVDSILGKNQKQAHFAHSSGKVCQYAAETALHKMAKEILFKHKSLMLPELYFNYEKIHDEFFLQFNTVELEQRIEKNGIVIIPDAILTKGNKQLFIEFYKSHLVDENKKSKIEALKTSTIEINLNFIEPIVNGEPNYEGVKEVIQNNSDFSEWIYNSQAYRLFIEKEKEIIASFKPEGDLVFMKEHNNSSFRNKTIHEDESRVNIEIWKEKAIAKGYELVKIYGHDNIIYCPEAETKANKIYASWCQSCEYFYGNYYPLGEKYSICGFKSKLKKNN